MANPLFPNLTRKIQDAARREFRRSEVGRAVSDMGRAVRSGNLDSRAAKRLAARLKHASAGGSLARLVASSTETGRMISMVAKYARDTSNRSIKDILLDALGPVGDLYRSILEPGRGVAGIDSDLQAAADLLRAFGADVRFPSGKGRVSDARKLLESLGFTVSKPGSPKKRRQPAKRKPAPRRPAPQPPEEPEVTFKTIEPGQPVETGNGMMRLRIGGRVREYRPNDPIITGEMIEVESSNVYAIGFLWNNDDPMNGTLQIRFKQSRPGSNRKSGPGPLYYYEGVHPDVFTAFRRAASKGVFVWDRIRIRGTKSGHRYPYRLAGITGGYVPRKATRYGGNEYFIRRRITARSTRTGQVRTFESTLPDRGVGKYQPERAQIGGRVDRGRPNRGR